MLGPKLHVVHFSYIQINEKINARIKCSRIFPLNIFDFKRDSSLCFSGPQQPHTFFPLRQHERDTTRWPLSNFNQSRWMLMDETAK